MRNFMKTGMFLDGRALQSQYTIQMVYNFYRKIIMK